MNLIASLCNGYGWSTLRKAKGNQSATDKGEARGVKRIFAETSSCDKDSEEQQQKHKQIKADDGNGRHKRDADPNESNQPTVKRRCRGKQPDPENSVVQRILEKGKQPVLKRRGRPAGSKTGKEQVDREGKKASLTVWKKMQIILEYERLKKIGTIKHVESFMLKNGKMRGGYQGCLSTTKWLGSRVKYKWDDFVRHCPKLSNQVHEVPHALLEVLGVSVPSHESMETAARFSFTFHVYKGTFI